MKYFKLTCLYPYSKVIFFFSLIASCERDAIGLENNLLIPDSWLTASSELSANTPAKNGRLNYTAGPSWCASSSDNYPYLEIDLQIVHIICAISTQGNHQADQWVKTFSMQSSTDGRTWMNYTDDQVNVNAKVPVNSHRLYPCLNYKKSHPDWSILSVLFVFELCAFAKCELSIFLPGSILCSDCNNYYYYMVKNILCIICEIVMCAFWFLPSTIIICASLWG